MRLEWLQLQQENRLYRSISRSSQNLHTRTSYEHPRRTFIQAPTQRIFKISMQGPLEEDVDRISTRSSHKDLCKIMHGDLVNFTRTCSRALRKTGTRSCKGLWQQATGISRRASHKDLQKTLTKIFTPGPLRRAHKIVRKGPAAAGADLTRSWYNFPRASHRSFHTSTCKTWPLQELKYLLERISPGSPQDLLFRTCTGSCKDLSERNLAGSPEERVYARIYNENAAGQELENPAAHVLYEPSQSKCAWTSHKSDFKREFLGKLPGPRS